MGTLDGKVCVVTGAAGVIGGETVRVLTREGAAVAAVDVNGEAGAALSLIADVTDAGQVTDTYRAVAERFGRIDVLFNNAGIALPEDGSVLDTDLATWNRVIEVNLTSIFLCCKYGIPYLLQGGGGWTTASATSSAGCSAWRRGGWASRSWAPCGTT